MIELIAGFLILPFCAYFGFVGDRYAGNGKKVLGPIFLAGAIFLPCIVGIHFTKDYFGFGIDDWQRHAVVLATFVLSVVAGLSLRRWFLWGATFMHNKRAPKEQGHEYIYNIAERLTKFKWETCSLEQLVILKMTMWMVHHLFAGALCAVMIAYFNETFVPLVMIVLVGLFRSYIYRLEYLQNSSTQLEESEPDAGLATYFLMAFSRL